MLESSSDAPAPQNRGIFLLTCRTGCPTLGITIVKEEGIMNADNDRCIEEEKSLQINYIEFLKATKRHKSRIAKAEARCEWIFNKSIEGVEYVKSDF